MKKQQHKQKRFRPKLKIQKGDLVVIIAGNYKGSEGKVLEVFPQDNKVIVEGVNMVSRHTKPDAQNPDGGIIKKEAPIHVSNLKLVFAGEATKVGRKIVDGKIVRYSKKTQDIIN